MAKGSRRIDSVDAVRGLAILLMVFSHGLNWFHVDGSHAVLSLGALSLGDAATPLFFVIAGVSLALSLTARRRTGAPVGQIRGRYGHRFRQLFVLGIPISFAWGVLQSQAVTLGLLVLLSLYVFERQPSLRPAPWAFAAAGVAAGLHAVTSRLDLASPILRLLLQGQFPLFAIMALVASGFGAGSLLRGGMPWRRRFFTTGAAFAGLALLLSRGPGFDEAGVAASGGGLLVRAHMPLPYVFLGLAATLLLTATFDLPSLRGRGPVHLLGRIGRHGLFLYLAHYGLILLQVALFGWWHTLDTAAATAAAMLLVLMTVFIGLHWQIDARVIYGRMDAFARWWSGRDPLPPGYPVDVPTSPVADPKAERDAGYTPNTFGIRTFR